MVGADGCGQFGRAGAEAESAGERDIRDWDVVIDLHPVVAHIERAVGVELDFDGDEGGRLIVGRTCAEVSELLRNLPSPADSDNDAWRVA